MIATEAAWRNKHREICSQLTRAHLGAAAFAHQLTTRSSRSRDLRVSIVRTCLTMPFDGVPPWWIQPDRTECLDPVMAEVDMSIDEAYCSERKTSEHS